jgi:hypothetical protein
MNLLAGSRYENDLDFSGRAWTLEIARHKRERETFYVGE